MGGTLPTRGNCASDHASAYIMPMMPDQKPTLEYATPQEKPAGSSTRRVIGLAGFLAYGVLALIFDAATLINLIHWRESLSDFGPLLIVATIGLLCTFRAVVILIEYIKR